MRQSVCELVRKGEVKRKGYAVESIKTTSGRKSDKVLEDLKKAAWYLDREIKRMKRE